MATPDDPRTRSRRRHALRGPLPRPFVVALLSLSACGAFAQKPLGQVGDEAGRLKVSIESLFSEIPKHGYLPLRVSIENNNSERAVSLLFEASSQDNQYWRGESTMGSSFQLGAEAGQTAEHEILVPIVPAYNHHGGYSGSGSSLTIRVSGGGLPDRQIGSHSDLMGSPSVALSTESHKLDWDAVRNSMGGGGSSSSGTFGARFAPERLPAHWRGLSGFDVLVLREDEWATVAPTARAAVLDWVRMGGRLFFWASGKEPDPSELGIEDLDRGRLGLGTVAGIAATGSDGGNTYLIGSRQLFAGTERAEGLLNAVTSDYVGTLGEALGTRPFNSTQVMLILVAFAVVVGPVNLFVLAKSGRRHRLFVTTPIISIVAGLLMAVLIFIQDGVGGKGVRASITFLDPGARKSYTTQEQIARTGVLLGRSFTAAEPLVLTPVVLNNSRWTFVNGDNSGGGIGYQVADQTFSGDWFRSRSEQGHLARWVQQTRESVQVLASETGPEGQPVILSTLAYTLGRLAYFDDKGDVWTGENIRTGEKSTLTKWESAAFQEWWHLGLASFGRSLIEAAWDGTGSAPAGRFYAIAADTGKPPLIETLDSLRWTTRQALVFGITETVGKGGPSAP